MFEDGLNGRTTTIDDPVEAGLNGAAALPTLLDRFVPLDLVVLMLGTNGLKAQYHREVEAIAHGIETLLRIIERDTSTPRDAPPRVLLVTPPAIRTLPGATRNTFHGAIPKARRLTPALLDVARHYGCEALEGSKLVAGEPSDGIHGIHLNAEGHRTLARNVTAPVWRILTTVDG